MIKIEKGLGLGLIVSLSWHVFCFKAVDFSFSGASSQAKPCNLSFLGQLLDKKDFLPQAVKRGGPVISVKEIEPAGNRDINLSALSAAGLIKPPADYLKSRGLIKEQGLVRQPLAAGDSGGLNQKLPNPFFYKELPLAPAEVELEILPSGNVSSVKRIFSSGDLDVDLYILKSVRRNLYLESIRQGLRFKRLKVGLDSND